MSSTGGEDRSRGRTSWLRIGSTSIEVDEHGVPVPRPEGPGLLRWLGRLLLEGARASPRSRGRFHPGGGADDPRRQG